MLYRDVWDQKPPGVHLTYAAGFALFGLSDRTVVLLDVLAATAACGFVFAIARRLRSVRFGWAAAIAFAIGTYPAFALPYGGFLERAVPETFITVLIAAAAWCAVTERFGVAGFAIGTAAVFKPTALIYWPVFALAATWTARDGGLKRLAISGVTAAIPIAAVLAWLWTNHALADAKIAVVDYNRAYVVAGSSWLAMPNILAHELWRLVKTDPLWCAAAFGGIAAIWQVASATGDRRSADSFVFTAAWLTAAVIAVAANGVRMYATYFLPTAPPLALLAGSLFDVEGDRRRLRQLFSAAALVVASAVAVRSHYPDRLLRYTAADIAQLRGTAPRGAYLEMFGARANGRGYSASANDELASYLRAHAAEGDRVYIFGMAPAVYFDARQLPANRFVWTFPAVAPFAGHPGFTVAALAADLESAAPRYLVLERHNRDSSTGWRIEDLYDAPSIRRLLENYEHQIEIDDFSVLRRTK